MDQERHQRPSPMVPIRILGSKSIVDWDGSPVVCRRNCFTDPSQLFIGRAKTNILENEVPM